MPSLVTSLENVEKQHRILQYMQAVMNSGSYSEGEQVAAAEKAISTLYHQEALCLNSCGSALFAILSFLVSWGHRHAVVQNNTFYATGAMALEAGLTVTLCDSRHDCPSMSVDSMITAIKRHSATVVILTHVAGWVAKDYAAIAQYCAEHDVVLIEDAAHAFGLMEVGSLGFATAFSFYPTKAVPIGEGGAVITSDAALYDYVSQFRSYGKHKVNGTIRYSRGMNLRMSEWDAAVLRVQVADLDQILSQRYQDAILLDEIAPCLLPITKASTWYKFPVRAEHAHGMRVTGKVYARSDQLDTCLSAYPFAASVDTVPSLSNSYAWSARHACLPAGEGLYRGMTSEQVSVQLRKGVA